MYLSLNFILEMIGLDPEEHGINDGMPKFRGVELYASKDEHHGE